MVVALSLVSCGPGPLRMDLVLISVSLCDIKMVVSVRLGDFVMAEV